MLWGLQKATASISFDELVAALRATPPPALLGSLAATLVSFIALLGYDLSGLRYVGARPPLRAVLLASFCGFAIGNTVGLGAFSGGAVHWPKGSTELISRTALSQRHVIVDPGIDVMP